MAVRRSSSMWAGMSGLTLASLLNLRGMLTSCNRPKAELATDEPARHLPTLSFVLLTHATTSHIGAFAHCCKHFPLFTQIPVYATAPVIAFGRTLLQDLYSSQPLAATFITPSGPETEAETPSANDTPRTNILAQAPTPEEIAKY